MGLSTSSFATLVLAAACAGSCLAGSSADRAWLGVVLTRQACGELYISSIAPGSPAERAGLLRGDRLLLLAESSVGFVPGMLLDFSPGDELRVTLERGDRRLELKVTLSEWPEGRPPPPLPVYRKQSSTSDRPSHLDRQEARLETGRWGPARSLEALVATCRRAMGAAPTRSSSYRTS